MWKFKSSWACCASRSSFLPLDWVGGKGVGPPALDWSPSLVLRMLWGLFGDHIWFSNQLSPFFSLPRPDNGTYSGLDGDKDSYL